MPGYDNPYHATYSYGALAFGGTSSSTTIRAPRTLSQGRILDIHVGVTVLFTAVTTPAFIRLGYAGDTDYYAELNMGTAAASAGYNTRDNTPAGNPPGPIFRKIDLANDPVPGPLTGVLVNFVAATGGSPAGTGTVTIHIGWF